MSIDRLGGQSGVEPWETLVIECEITEVLETIVNHATNDNMDKAVSNSDASE